MQGKFASFCKMFSGLSYGVNSGDELMPLTLLHPQKRLKTFTEGDRYVLYLEG